MDNFFESTLTSPDEEICITGSCCRSSFLSLLLPNELRGEAPLPNELLGEASLFNDVLGEIFLFTEPPGDVSFLKDPLGELSLLLAPPRGLALPARAVLAND